MKFYEITEEMRAVPGEYLYHEPSKQMVMCGSFSRQRDQIRVLSNGKLFTDKIDNFKKVTVTKKERVQRRSRRCGGCKK